MTTHAAPLDVRAAGPGEGCSAFVATIRDPDGRRLGLAASAVRGGAPELGARDAVVAALAACRPIVDTLIDHALRLAEGGDRQERP
ncbi:hypothetical protein ABZ839_32330 [Streptomyces cellulosae]